MNNNTDVRNNNKAVYLYVIVATEADRNKILSKGQRDALSKRGEQPRIAEVQAALKARMKGYNVDEIVDIQPIKREDVPSFKKVGGRERNQKTDVVVLEATVRDLKKCSKCTTGISAGLSRSFYSDK